MVKEFFKWYFEQANTGNTYRQMTFAIIIPFCILFFMLLVISFVFAPSQDSLDSGPAVVKTTPKPTVEKTAVPTQTYVQLIYDDEYLAETILDGGQKFVQASSEFPNAIAIGDLDMAERGRQAMILEISDLKSDLKDLTVKDHVMKSSWEEYLKTESSFLYQIGKVIKSTRNDKYADARASMITAQKYLLDANSNYQSAKSRALSIV